MCNYCGCRDFPLIARLSAEHEDIANAAGRLRTSILHGTDDRFEALDALIDLLMPHTATEENGLFRELRAEGSLTEEVDKLCAEHDDIHGVLGSIDRQDPDWAAVLAALERLTRHIDNEEHGLFPASVIVLPITAWDRVTYPTTSESPTQPADDQQVATGASS
ncbi:hypothetical protein GCM10027290_63800 [Micromonospora sonneratiae]|uniref:Hemerythrin domain-containing protein n=1 Tax=Micromonospora sonneratiae TaxID=1184706 RepID=A0ABW3YGU3_9ACTN